MRILYCAYKSRNQTNKGARIPKLMNCFSINGEVYRYDGLFLLNENSECFVYQIGVASC